MAMWIAHRPPMNEPGRALLWAVAAFGGAIVLFGVSRWFWLSFVALLLTGAFDNISVTRTGNISGAVYNDANNNFKRDPGEVGLSSHTVYVDADYDGHFDQAGPFNFSTGTVNIPIPDQSLGSSSLIISGTGLT